MSNTNTNYDWKNVSDDYLEEIIAIQHKCALRFIRYNQWEKLRRAESIIEAARAERKARVGK